MSDPQQPPAAPVVWPADPRQFADPRLCPACLTVLAGVTCPRCGVDLRAPEGMALRESASAIYAAEQHRLEALAAYQAAAQRWAAEYAARAAQAPAAAPGPQAAVPPAPVPAPVAPVAAPQAPTPSAATTHMPPAASPAPAPASAAVPPVPRRSGVQLFLMIAGLSLLAIAALFFLVVAYTLTSVEGRVLITAGIAVAVLAVAALLDRRKLDSTAAGLTILAGVILTTAAVIAWTADAFGLRAVSLGLYAAIAGAVIAAIMVLAATVGRIRVAGIMSILFGLTTLASVGAWIGTLLVPGDPGTSAVLSTSMLGLVIAGPLSAVRRVPTIEAALMRGAALLAAVVGVLRVPIAPSVSPIADVVLLVLTGLLALGAALAIRRVAAGSWWTVGFFSAAALALAVAPAAAVLRSDLVVADQESIIGMGGAVVTAGIALLTARLAAAESRGWWRRWLPTVVAAAVMLIPALLLVPMALLRLGVLLLAPLAPWRLDAIAADLGLTLVDGFVVSVESLLPSAVLACVAVAAIGFAVLIVCRFAFPRAGLALAMVAGPAALLAVALVPGILVRLVLLAAMGATGLVLLARTRGAGHPATRLLGHFWTVAAAVVLALSAPASIVGLLPSVLLAIALLVAEAALARGSGDVAAARWPGALGATLALLWAAGWALPFVHAVQGIASPPAHRAALVLAGVSALVLLAVAAVAHRVGTRTRVAITAPAAVALVVAALVVATGGERVATLVVAFGVAVIGVLWLALPTTRQLPEAAALGALVPPALAGGIIRTGTGDPLPTWVLLAAVLLVVAAAAVLVPKVARAVVQASTGIVSLPLAAAIPWVAMPDQALVGGLGILLLALIPLAIARTWAALFQPGWQRHLAWIGLPLALGAISLGAYGIAPDLPEAYGVPSAVLLIGLGLLVAWREPLRERVRLTAPPVHGHAASVPAPADPSAPAPASAAPPAPSAPLAAPLVQSAPDTEEPTGTAPSPSRVGVVRTLLLIAGTVVGVAPTAVAIALADHALVRAVVLGIVVAVLLVAGALVVPRWRGVPASSLLTLLGYGAAVVVAFASLAGDVAWVDGAVREPTAYGAAVLIAAAAVAAAASCRRDGPIRMWSGLIALLVVVGVAGSFGGALELPEPWSVLAAVALGVCAVSARQLAAGLRTALMVAAGVVAVVPTAVALGAGHDALPRAIALLTLIAILFVGGATAPVRWRDTPLTAVLTVLGAATAVVVGLAALAGLAPLADGPVRTPFAYAAAALCALAAVAAASSRRPEAVLRATTSLLATCVVAAFTGVVALMQGIGGPVEPWSLLVAVTLAAVALLLGPVAVGARLAVLIVALVIAVVPTAAVALAGGSDAFVRILALLVAAVVCLVLSRLVPARWRGLSLPAVLVAAGSGIAAAAVVPTAAAAAVDVATAGLDVRGVLGYVAFVLIALGAALAIRVADALTLVIAAVAVVAGLALWARAGGPVEPYTAVVGVVLVLRGLARLAADPRLRTMPELAAGLLLILVPSLVYDYLGTDLWRAVALGVAALGILLWGLLRRWQAPFLLGGVVLVLHAVAQAWPWIIQLYEATTVWVWIALGGAILVTIAATYEARIKNAKALARAIRSLR